MGPDERQGLDVALRGHEIELKFQMHRLDHTAERFVANHHRPVHLDVLAHGVDGVPPTLAHEAERSSGLSERPRLTPSWRAAEALAETPAIRVVAQRVSNDPLDDLVGKLWQPGRATCVPPGGADGETCPSGYLQEQKCTFVLPDEIKKEMELMEGGMGTAAGNEVAGLAAGNSADGSDASGRVFDGDLSTSPLTNLQRWGVLARRKELMAEVCCQALDVGEDDDGVSFDIWRSQ